MREPLKHPGPASAPGPTTATYSGATCAGDEDSGDEILKDEIFTHPIDAVAVSKTFLEALKRQEAGIHYEMACLLHLDPNSDMQEWDRMLSDNRRAQFIVGVADNERHTVYDLHQAGLHDYACALSSGDYKSLMF